MKKKKIRSPVKYSKCWIRIRVHVSARCIIKALKRVTNTVILPFSECQYAMLYCVGGVPKARIVMLLYFMHLNIYRRARFKICSHLISNSGKIKKFKNTTSPFQTRSENLKNPNITFKQDPRI